MDAKKVICDICHSEFWSRGNRARYCSPECRKAGNYYARPQKATLSLSHSIKTGPHKIRLMRPHTR